MEVTIVGAYGYTGQLICKEFDSLGIRYNVAGRNLQDLEELKNKFSMVSYCLLLDMIIEDDINTLLSKSDIIVNCAGPFSEESSLLLEKAARSGKYYVDISGELGFVKNSFEKYQSIAKESNSLIVHACAFESLIADLVLQTTSPYESVKTFYWFNQKSVSPGTKLTMKLSQYHDPLCISERKWKSFNDGIRFNIRMGEQKLTAVPYPLPEIAFAKKRTNCKNAHSFLLLDKAEAKYVSNSSKLGGDPITKLNKLKERKSKGPSPENRALQRSRIVLEFSFSDGSSIVKTVENIDMYQTTAKAIVLAVKTFLKNYEVPRGVICPATLFKGRESEALEELSVSPIVISFNRESC
jgi:short subunit dehydrogenase-like uncharacterized protein